MNETSDIYAGMETKVLDPSLWHIIPQETSSKNVSGILPVAKGCTKQALNFAFRVAYLST